MEGKWMVNGEQSASASDEQPTAPPVVGVILMFAITVILGGLIGTFVLRLGDRANRVPRAQYSVDFSDSGDGYHDDDDWITVTHEGGDPIDPQRIRVVVDGQDVDGIAGHWSDPVTAGDTLTITDGTHADHARIGRIDGGDRILIIWEHPRIERSTILTETAGPVPVIQSTDQP